MSSRVRFEHSIKIWGADEVVEVDYDVPAQPPAKNGFISFDLFLIYLNSVGWV